MRIDIISLFPDFFQGPFDESIVKRAKENGKVEILIHNLRDYSEDKHKKVDDYAYGGGAGMVLRIEPVAKCLETLKAQRNYDEIIYLTPDGELLDQPLANSLSTKNNIILLCGHYKGIDERIREHLITREVSIGNYVMTGGELAAAVLTDCVVRLVPGVLGDETSALSDSFQDGLLAPPVYTRPEKFQNWSVPEILRSGNTKKIEEWLHHQAIKRTKERRPGLLDSD